MPSQACTKAPSSACRTATWARQSSGLIVVEPGQSPDLEQIMEAMQATLARFKQPRRLIVVPELPRNAMAKVQKNILREQFKDAVHAI